MALYIVAKAGMDCYWWGGEGSEETLKSTCKQLREQGEVRLMSTMKSSLPKENSTECSHVVKHPTINSLSNKTKDGDKYLPLVQIKLVYTHSVILAFQATCLVGYHQVTEQH